MECFVNICKLIIRIEKSLKTIAMIYNLRNNMKIILRIIHAEAGMVATILKLFIIDRLGVDDVAARLNMKPSDVRSHLVRVLLRFQKDRDG